VPAALSVVADVLGAIAVVVGRRQALRTHFAPDADGPVRPVRAGRRRPDPMAWICAFPAGMETLLVDAALAEGHSSASRSAVPTTMPGSWSKQ
jgi:hypothetical protein